VTEVSTHILDTVTGEPASGVVVRLERAGQGMRGGEAGTGANPGTGGAEPGSGRVTAVGRVTEIGQGTTDLDGRITDFGAGPLEPGAYRLVFETGPYLSAEHPGRPGSGEGAGGAFFPEVVVTFMADGRRSRYHIPLLLSPYSYTTYRGS
jgi:5-hydroxyisourate hydrolase